MLRVPVTSADHILGSANAPVTLVEYGDYECPHCGLAHPIVQQVIENFRDRMRFVFRHFPLTQAHPNAQPAAETAEFADVILPATSHAEKEGTYTNTDRCVQLARQAMAPPGQARSDWEVLVDLSRRMGYPMEYHPIIAPSSGIAGDRR